MLDKIAMILELLFLGWITLQGEYIRYYEREVHRIQSEREKERAAWRESKRKQATKKAEASITSPALIVGDRDL